MCGATSRLRKTTTDFRIGAGAHLNDGVVQKSAFARFLASFDFRLFQHHRSKAEGARIETEWHVGSHLKSGHRQLDRACPKSAERRHQPIRKDARAGGGKPIYLTSQIP